MGHRVRFQLPIIPIDNIPVLPPIVQCVVPPTLYQFGYFVPPDAGIPAWPGLGWSIDAYISYLSDLLFYLWTWLLWVLSFFGNIFVAIGNFGLVWWFAAVASWYHLWELWDVSTTVIGRFTIMLGKVSSVFQIALVDAPTDFERFCS